MQDIQAIRRSNTAHIVREQFGGVRVRLAERLNEMRAGDEGFVQPGYVTRILDLDSSGARAIGDQMARRIERAALKPENWLDQQRPLHVLPEDDGPLIPPAQNRASVPVTSWLAAAAWAGAGPDLFNPTESEWIETTEMLGAEDAIGLVVENDAMQLPDALASFPMGCTIIVKRLRLRLPVNGDYVVVRLAGEIRPTFRQLIFDGDRQYLRPLNAAYPTIQVDDSDLFIGVVIEKIIRARY